MVGKCWCCGQECMFCTPEENVCEGNLHGDIPGVHWCTWCKFSGCDWCCGCPECQQHQRGGWSPSGVQVRHGGAWDRVLVSTGSERQQEDPGTGSREDGAGQGSPADSVPGPAGSPS